MKKLFEESFFGFTFEFIKNHKLFSNLNINDQEIIDFRNEIKESIAIHKECNKISGVCSTYKPHIFFIRTPDNKLITGYKNCKKKRNFWTFTDDIIKELFDEYLYPKLEHLNKKNLVLQIEKLINYLNNNSIKNKEQILSWIKELGVSKKLSGYFSFGEEITLKKTLTDICVAFPSLAQSYTILIHANDLKKIILNYSTFSFNNNENKYKAKYQKLINVQHLFIIDFGLEDQMMKNNYYLDHLLSFLQKRKEKNNQLVIITSINLNEWKNSVLNDPKFSLNSQNKINTYKLQELIVYINELVQQKFDFIN